MEMDQLNTILKEECSKEVGGGRWRRTGSKALVAPRDQFPKCLQGGYTTQACSCWRAGSIPGSQLGTEVSGRLQARTLEMLPPLEAFLVLSPLHVSRGPTQSLASGGWNGIHWHRF